MKQIKYYVEYGISIYQGDNKIGELKFDLEEDMWKTLKKLDEEGYKWQKKK